MPSPKRIGKIEFGLLSPKEIRKMSVRKIIWADTYDEDGYPYPQGLMDLNLGVIDPGLRCKTCDQKASECPGHFGHIELAKPVIHVGYTRLIRKLLRVTCRACSRLLMGPEEIEKVVGTDEEGTTTEVVSEKDIKKEHVCPHCGEQIELFGKGGGKKIAEELAVPYLGAIPLDIEMRKAGDEGRPFIIRRADNPTWKSVDAVMEELIRVVEG